MEWTLAILLIIAAILLIVSVVKTRQSSKVEQREIDTVYVSLMEEINKLQEKIRTIELDGEITAQEARVLGMNTKDRLLLRESLDLYKRGYTLEGIAEKTKVTERKVESLLTPYMVPKLERGTVSNES